MQRVKASKSRATCCFHKYSLFWVLLSAFGQCKQTVCIPQARRCTLWQQMWVAVGSWRMLTVVSSPSRRSILPLCWPPKVLSSWKVRPSPDRPRLYSGVLASTCPLWLVIMGDLCYNEMMILWRESYHIIFSSIHIFLGYRVQIESLRYSSGGCGMEILWPMPWKHLCRLLKAEAVFVVLLVAWWLDCNGYSFI